MTHDQTFNQGIMIQKQMTVAWRQSSPCCCLLFFPAEGLFLFTSGSWEKMMVLSQGIFSSPLWNNNVVLITWRRKNKAPTCRELSRSNVLLVLLSGGSEDSQHKAISSWAAVAAPSRLLYTCYWLNSAGLQSLAVFTARRCFRPSLSFSIVIRPSCHPCRPHRPGEQGKNTQQNNTNRWRKNWIKTAEDQQTY